jgi:CRISPR-associated endonuclease Csn1
LTRDVRATRNQREQIVAQQRDNQKTRTAAVKLIEEWAPGAENSRETQRRARLWMEQGHHCLYTGQPISPQAAFSAVTEIDHILPRSATLDNSLANAALVMSSANRDKGDRTIFEWAGPNKVEEVADRAKSMGLRRGKTAKLTKEHVDPESIPESLVITTGYINAVARDYVKQLTGVTPEVTRGRLTAHMRYRLGLSKDETDHRRHALDAAMVAMTSRSIAMNLARRYRRDETSGNAEGWGSWEPWEGARNQIESAVDDIVVSHRVQGRVRGQLHEETRYGKVASEDSASVYARRRPLAGGLSRKQLNEVADPVVRSSLVADLIERGVDPEAATVTFDSDNPPTMPDGQVIKSVRCHANLPSNFFLKPDTEPKTSVTPARNHQALVFSNNDIRKHRIVVISRFEAFRRRNQTPASIAAEFIYRFEHLRFSLCIGDAVAFTDPSTGTRTVEVVKRLGRSSARIYLRPAHDNRTGAEGVRRATAKFFNEHDVEKVVITPAGLIRWARD